MSHVDYLICSEKFASQYAGNEHKALSRLAKLAPVVIITLGERGLIWQRGNEQGAYPLIPLLPLIPRVPAMLFMALLLRHWQPAWIGKRNFNTLVPLAHCAACKWGHV